MKLSQLGEEGLLKLLTGRWRSGTGVRVGVGDDCAVLRSRSSGENLLFKTDAVVEKVHFTPATGRRLVGRKALARALSDIAAMGGEPWAALITIGVPAAANPADLRRVYAGLEALARRHKVRLVGGETVRAPVLFLSIALLGRMRTGAPVLRSTARAGDEIWVTGRLGASARGRHLLFEPRLAEGQWLARHGLARAMMDLSDGLGADLPRLAKASRLDFVLDEQAVPRAPGASIRAAINDGEDYELLLSVAPRDAARLRRLWPFRTRITRIGKLIVRDKARKKSLKKYGGYDHFKKR
jgi:thiamine-monophosphate kinase